MGCIGKGAPFISQEPASGTLQVQRHWGDTHVYAKRTNVSKQYSFKLKDCDRIFNQTAAPEASSRAAALDG
jgi:hypothetical protein